MLAQPGNNYAPGTTYTLLTAGGGVSGTFTDVTSNFFLDPMLSYDPTTVFLTFARNSTTFSSLAETSNQRAVAGALDRLPESNAVYLGVLNQTTEDGARQAFDALSGEAHATVAGTLVHNSHMVRDAILGRLTQASYGSGEQTMALAAGGLVSVAASEMGGRMALGMGNGTGDSALPPAYGHGLTFWARGFGARGDFDGNGNAAGAERNLGGFVSGVDARIGNGWRAGIATGYMRSDLSVAARASSADIDSYVLAGYAGGAYGPIALRSGAAWTWHSVDGSRAVVFPGFNESLRADYNANTGQIFGELAYPILVGPSALEPFAGLGYVHVDTDGFTERGGDAALRASGHDQDVGYATLGLRAATTATIGGYTVTPHASLAWQHAFGDITPERSFAFASTNVAFGIAGAPIARNSALVEAGLDIVLPPGATLSLSYFGQLAEDVTDNGVQGRLNWRF